MRAHRPHASSIFCISQRATGLLGRRIRIVQAYGDPQRSTHAGLSTSDGGRVEGGGEGPMEWAESRPGSLTLDACAVRGMPAGAQAA